MRDAILWLEGCPTVRIVCLIKFTEEPEYRCPTQQLSDSEFDALNFPSGPEIQEGDFIIDSYRGPVMYKGLCWVGRLSEGFLEVWHKDRTGTPVRKGNRQVVLLQLRIACHANVVLQSLFTNLSNLNGIRFRLGDLLPLQQDDNRVAKFDWQDFKVIMRDSLPELAASRCRQMIRQRNKRTSETTDRDFAES